MLDIQKRGVQLLLCITFILALSMTAEKFRELVGKEAASKSGQFTFLNCFDMGSGILACTAKEGVKLYIYNLRTTHMELVWQRVIEKALDDGVTEGLTPTEAAKQAQKVGAKVAKVAAYQAKRILGPIISSGWDFFEVMYFGVRGTSHLIWNLCGLFPRGGEVGKVGISCGKSSRQLGWEKNWTDDLRCHKQPGLYASVCPARVSVIIICFRRGFRICR